MNTIVGVLILFEYYFSTVLSKIFNVEIVFIAQLILILSSEKYFVLVVDVVRVLLA